MIRRPFYMDKFRDLHSSEVVKVIVGVRRCGKSTLLKQLRNDLVEQGVSPEAIIYIDFELPSNAPLTDTSAFLSFVGERASPTFSLTRCRSLKDGKRLSTGLGLSSG